LNSADDGGWTDALRSGNFQHAWKISDQRLREYCASGATKHTGERHFQRIWRGEDLRDRRVLVRCYHGLGDTIQFIRFAKPLREIAREVVVWGQPELLALLSQVDGVDRAFPLHDGTPDFAYDVDIEVMELAHALRATPELISGRVPYFPIPSGQIARASLTAPISVGLVWEAGNWDRRRCVPPRLLARLQAATGVRLCSLQQGSGRRMAPAIPAADIAIADIQSLAATIKSLDLVITVDTMVAHLAGALGAPVWTMLHADCDWRWPKAGRQSLWYPTMRLFHQRTAGDWTGVIEEVTEELTRYSRSNRRLCES
jgi:Glycosyltransferase family 9 (heptosyltransferase)